MVTVVALHLPGRIALLDDGRTVPIVSLFDVCGDPTDDLDLAAGFLVTDGRTAFCDCIDEYPEVPLQ